MADPPADVAAWRRERRAALIAARLALDPEAHGKASRAVTAQLVARFLPLPGRRLGAYWPVRNEIDPRPFLEQAAAAGATLALPVVFGPGLPLGFRAWQPGGAMTPGAHGIPHPAAGEPVVPDVLLIPLLGFDEAGYRLGYGGGYYDRTLAAASPAPLTIGLGFAAARLETIHPQPHDCPLDFIVTETGLLQLPRRL